MNDQAALEWDIDDPLKQSYSLQEVLGEDELKIIPEQFRRLQLAGLRKMNDCRNTTFVWRTSEVMSIISFWLNSAVDDRFVFVGPIHSGKRSTLMEFFGRVGVEWISYDCSILNTHNKLDVAIERYRDSVERGIPMIISSVNHLSREEFEFLDSRLRDNPKNDSFHRVFYTYSIGTGDSYDSHFSGVDGTFVMNEKQYLSGDVLRRLAINVVHSLRMPISESQIEKVCKFVEAINDLYLSEYNGDESEVALPVSASILINWLRWTHCNSLVHQASGKSAFYEEMKSSYLLKNATALQRGKIITVYGRAFSMGGEFFKREVQ